MSKEVSNTIHNILVENLIFNQNDLLLNVFEENNAVYKLNEPFSNEFSVFPKRILSKASENYKEKGVHTLCLSTHIVCFQFDNKNYQAPIFLDGLTFKKVRTKDTIVFDLVEDGRLLNPFLERILQKELNVELDQLDEEAILNDIKINLGPVENVQFIANFHPHRFELLKELEALSIQNDFSFSVKQMLNFSEGAAQRELKLPSNLLFSSNKEQSKVLNVIKTQNVSLQGPPGTGKSTLISNLVAQGVKAKKRTIVISEKRAALQVIQSKLKTKNLDRLCFIPSSVKPAKSYLKKLEDNWAFYDNYESQQLACLNVSKNHVDQLQMMLDLLGNKNLLGGVSISEFYDLKSNFELVEKYSSEVISIRQLIDNEKLLIKIYAQQLSVSLAHLNHTVFKSDAINILDQDLQKLKVQHKELQQVFEFKTLAELDQAISFAAKIQVFENDVFKQFKAILKPNSRKQKRFLSLRKKWKKAKIEQESFANLETNWLKIPSRSEMDFFVSLLGKTSFFGKRKARKAWLKFSDKAIETAVVELENLSRYYYVIDSFTHLNTEFCELNIENVDVELELVNAYILKMTSETWNEIQSMSAERQKEITASHDKLSQFRGRLKALLNLTDLDQFDTMLLNLENSLPHILKLKAQLQNVPAVFLKRLKFNPTFSDYKSEVLHSHWVNFEVQYPSFSQLKNSQLKDKIELILSEREKETLQFVDNLHTEISSQFHKYQKIIETPSVKLSVEDKALKKELRQGKSILVKEFSKVKQHKSLRELNQSSAKLWMDLLLPVWLSNTSSVAQTFPLEIGLFDLCIFDESSQIPLQNTLAILQRSDRVLVAGDSQQMGPSSYFQQSDSEIIDLLHQSNFQLDNHFISQHYRSEQAQLIAFSNKHFYNQTLVAFPTPNLNNHSVIKHTLVNGSFNDRKNEIEAKKAASAFVAAINDGENVGLVAFSEAQLNCITACFTVEQKLQIDSLVDQDKVFLKTLENVQGDECDHLIISFGYGYNSDKQFAHRFGPVNLANGAKRLNVLFTRARKSINFISSVCAADFKPSDNYGVELLKKWFVFVESNNVNTVVQEFALPEEVKGASVSFKEASAYFTNAEELISYHETLTARGWNVMYQ